MRDGFFGVLTEVKVLTAALISDSHTPLLKYSVSISSGRDKELKKEKTSFGVFLLWDKFSLNSIFKTSHLSQKLWIFKSSCHHKLKELSAVLILSEGGQCHFEILWSWICGTLFLRKRKDEEKHVFEFLTLKLFREMVCQRLQWYFYFCDVITLSIFQFESPEAVWAELKGLRELNCLFLHICACALLADLFYMKKSEEKCAE